MAIIEVCYGGRSYLIASRTMTDVQREITELASRPGGGWLEVREEGPAAAPVQLLVSTGVPLALTTPGTGEETQSQSR